MRLKMMVPLLLAAFLAACGERVSVAIPDIDTSPDAMARDQYRHLRARGDAVASKLKGGEPVWYPLFGRYKEWAALMAKTEALPVPPPAFTELSYKHLDSELDWIERQADTYAQFIELRRSADYRLMRRLATKFAAADRELAPQLTAWKAGDGEVERTAIFDVLTMAYKLREGMRSLDAMRAMQATLNELQPDTQQQRLMTALVRRAEHSVRELYALDGEAEAFEALRAFAAAEVHFTVDKAACSRLEVDGAPKGWYLPVRAFDANEDEIDYVTIGRHGGPNVSPYFHMVASKAACEQIASRLKNRVLASKPAGTFGMHYPDGMPRFELAGTY